MDDPIAWLAAAATLAAAMMTAANLGPRVTGAGFAVFALGSVAWCAVALRTGQDSLLLTNAVLLLVNITGIWRWLGREVMLERGRARAMLRSLKAPVPSLFSAGAAIGSPVHSPATQESLGQIVDLMIRCDDHALSYAVLSRGGIGGIGEELFALPARSLVFEAGKVGVNGRLPDIDRLPKLERDNWPARPATQGVR